MFDSRAEKCTENLSSLQHQHCKNCRHTLDAYYEFGGLLGFSKQEQTRSKTRRHQEPNMEHSKSRREIKQYDRGENEEYTYWERGGTSGYSWTDWQMRNRWLMRSRTHRGNAILNETREKWKINKKAFQRKHKEQQDKTNWIYNDKIIQTRWTNKQQPIMTVVTDIIIFNNNSVHFLNTVQNKLVTDKEPRQQETPVFHIKGLSSWPLTSNPGDYSQWEAIPTNMWPVSTWISPKQHLTLPGRS